MAEEPRKPSATYGPQAPAIPVVAQAPRRPYPWQSEKPTQPGWYVYKYNDSYLDADRMQTLIVEIRNSKQGLIMAHIIDEDGDFVACLLAETWDGLWKGPLDLENL